MRSRSRFTIPALAGVIAVTLSGPALAASGLPVALPLDMVAAPSTPVSAPIGADIVAEAATTLLGVSEADVFVPGRTQRADGGLDIVIPVDGAPITVRVYPHSIRAAGYTLRADLGGGNIVERDPGPSRLVKGMIAGADGSGVVGSDLDDGLYLSVRFADGRRMWVEPIGDRIAGARPNDHAVYDNADILPTGATCGFGAAIGGFVNEVPADGGPVAADVAALSGTQGSGGPLVLCVTELANDADVEYFQDYGSVQAVQDRIELITATVNLQYESEVGITHVITDTLVRTAEPDPYSENTNTELLCQFINEWTNNQQVIPRDVAQLYTGREISGSVIGQAAAIGSICEPDGCTTFPCDCGPFGTDGSYCFSQSDFNGNFASATDLTAHELGHLWNAFHCSCPSFTMNPSITSSNTFEPTVTRPAIEAYRDSRPCLDCLEAVEFVFPNGIPEQLDPSGTVVRVRVDDGLGVAQPGTGILHLDTGGGFVEIPMTEITPNLYDAVFPPIECPTEVAFFFSVQVPGIGAFNNPSGAPADVYVAIAADTITVPFDDDFETDQGWSVQNSAGLTDGAWDRGVPAGGGDRGDPASDFDGSGQCYLTDNADGNSDVDGGSTTLISPRFDATAEGLVLSYARWFDNAFGASPDADVFVVDISTDNGATWSNLETVGPAGPGTNGGWFDVSFVLSDLGIGSTDELRLRFIAADAGDGSVIEAGVDAVRLVAAECDTVDLCPADVDDSGAVDFNDLLAVLSAFGPCDGCPEDILLNGVVDFQDLLTLLSAWGPCP